jgi:type IV pilus assembly protein PilE
MNHVQSITVRACGNQGLFRRRAAGFTLIELMVVVAVVAILAAIAYPSYTDSVRKSRRAQAKADLVEYAAEAERFRTVNNTYLTAGATTFTLPAAKSPREASAPAHYALALSAQTDNAFTITATAQGDQARDRCGNLSITNAGVKGAALTDCW